MKVEVAALLNVHRIHKAYQGLGEREGVWRWERDIIYLSLHCHHWNDFCIKMGSDESRFNVPLIVRDIVTKAVFINQKHLKGRESRNGIEPKSFCLPT